MKSKRSDLEQRFLLLYKLDAQNLHDRVVDRKEDYIETFSLKRNRSIFKEVFDNRYSKSSIEDLSHCPAEIIESLNQFYICSDELFWYLKHTQDMPKAIEDEVNRRIIKFENLHKTLNLYIDAELSGQSVSDFGSIESDDIFDDQFTLRGEQSITAAGEEFLQEDKFLEEEE